MNQDRWNCKFGQFVSGYGISTLAQALDCDKTAIFHWVAGRTFPKPPHACAMQFLAAQSGMTLTLDDIYAFPRQYIAEACSKPTTDLPAALARAKLGPVEKKVAAILRQNPKCR